MKLLIAKLTEIYKTRIVTYYVGHSSRGLWGLVWSDFINMNLVCDIESSFIILCENSTYQAGKTKNRFGLQVWFGRRLLPLLKHLYLGQVYIWFGFWELQKPYNALFVIIYGRNYGITDGRTELRTDQAFYYNRFCIFKIRRTVS